MASTFLGQKRIRKYFGKIREVLEMPNLIEVQKSSYDLFLNSGDGPEPRDGDGIKGVFQSVFPIKDFNETAVLEFVRYELEKPKFDVEECQARDMTYAAPLKVTLRLIVFDVDEDTGARSVKDIKEQDVYMGDMPLMTSNGTFIVNGTERVIVSQMHRSPGRVLRPRQGQDACQRQAAVRLPDHSLSRVVAGLRVRRQGHRVRADRPSPEAAGDQPALFHGDGPGGDHGRLLRHGHVQARQEQGLGHPVLPRAHPRHPSDA
jgi:DNA-directed RNA polymerase beta subunit